jgi:hypothetical protein
MNPKQKRRVAEKKQEAESVGRFFLSALFGDTEETLTQALEQEAAARKAVPPRRGGP